jgi:hypothetical protein
MKCWSGRLFTTVLVLWSFGGAARADVITPWTYAWSRDPISVPSDAAGTGGISMTLNALAPGTHIVGDSDIGAVTLSTFSSAPPGTVDTFTNTHYSLSIHLTDMNSNQSGDLTFNGVFNGTLSTTNADINTTFLDPISQDLILGGHKYTVALNSYVPPGLPDSTVFGSIGSHVSITDATGGTGGNGGNGNGGNVNDAPEPSAWLLAGLALPTAGLAWLRAARGSRGRQPAAG